MNHHNVARICVRLPHDVKGWLEEQAHQNLSSQTSEIVRAIRERMGRDLSIGGANRLSRRPVVDS